MIQQMYSTLLVPTNRENQLKKVGSPPCKNNGAEVSETRLPAIATWIARSLKRLRTRESIITNAIGINPNSLTSPETAKATEAHLWLFFSKNNKPPTRKRIISESYIPHPADR